jgi:chemotaxis protein methyltransferase CheR
MQPERSGSIQRLRFDYVRRFISERTGMVLESDKEYYVELRLAMVAAELGFSSTAQLYESLMTEEAWGVLHTAVAEKMVITETSFFRDHHPFEQLKTTVIPELIARRAEHRSLTIWCAAVASGQEPYSLAMLIREHFPELTRWRLRMIVTDFSTAMLARCRSGLYSQIEVNRGLPVHYLVKYFTPEGSSWLIREPLRAMLEVRELNLVQPWPALPPCDLVLMRNVLIYFTPETCRTILQAAGEVLREDGVLLLGSSECVPPADPSFEARTVGRTLVHYPRRQRAA